MSNRIVFIQFQSRTPMSHGEEPQLSFLLKFSRFDLATFNYYYPLVSPISRVCCACAAFN